MAKHDFSELYARYPAIIAQMPKTFTSHSFILELARQNQTLYVEALYSYRHHERRGVSTPFMIVHGVLAQHLLSYPDLIVQVPETAQSKNIFGQDEGCTMWRKI